MKFNVNPIETKMAAFSPPDDLLKSDFCIRRMKLDEAWGKSEFLDNLLKSCPIKGTTKYILVDARVQHLKKGERTEKVGWHVDFRIEDPTPYSYEINHLWCSAFPTVFSIDPEFEENVKDVGEIRKKVIPKIKQEQLAKIGHWHTYDRSRLHRGPKVEESGVRFFVRVSEVMDKY